MIGTDRGAEAPLVVVGASLAGLRAVEELRRCGYPGRITVIGDEQTAPYDRPPLSKSMLTAAAPTVPILPREAALDVGWRLGTGAVGLDREARSVRLADGEGVAYHRLLIATGRRARPWSSWSGSPLDGVLTVRSLEDGIALRERLAGAPRRVAIIGAGFIGCEVASSCRELGLDVSVVARGACPLDGALGESVGAWATALFAAHDVDLHTTSDVTAVHDDGTGRVAGLTLGDGQFLAADLVVVATGSVPNVDWLSDSGLDVAGGVAVSDSLQALTVEGEPCEDVFAAGDVTRWAHPLYRDRLLSIEHWGNAVEQGRYAARSMLARTDAAEPFLEVPRFWSTMFGVNIKSVGVPSFADDVVLVQGAPEKLRGVFVYGRRGRCVAAVSFDAPRELANWEHRVVAGEPFPPSVVVPDWGRKTPPAPVPARFPARRTTRPQPGDGAAGAVLAGDPRAPGADHARH